ncbi:MAG: MBL fold metallo-hydrolase [Deltaproteobacteria bacterium]|nr:MBL fold metallo-hydrolase [Deltaproteobacteria bacterium]
MRLTIHRGTREIGGSCVELASGATRIVLDLGMPLPGPKKTNITKESPLSPSDLIASGLLPNIRGLYAWDNPGVDAVFLSHAHRDHYGLAGFIHPRIPVYLSAGTRALMELNEIFMAEPPVLSEKRLLADRERLEVGDFAITPYLVDHSAPDAMALLVEAGGKRLFYSGDLRGHGRKRGSFERILHNPPRNIDCLLLEGTALGRSQGVEESRPDFPDEQSVEEELVSLLSAKTNLALMLCSSQNLDRLVSAYRAVLRTNSLMVIDLYTAFVLQALSPLSPRLPQYHWRGMRIKYWKNHAEKLAGSGHQDFLYAANKHKIKMPELIARRAEILMLTRSAGLFPLITRSLPDYNGLKIVWSMWRGYLTGEEPVSKFCRKNNLEINFVHTSGHAPLKDLKRLAEALQPHKTIPIHTGFPHLYRDFFPNVHCLEDGEELSI